MQFGAKTASILSCRCVGCGAEREVPEPDRPRMPAAEQGGAVTVEVDERCNCGSRRVRIELQLE